MEWLLSVSCSGFLLNNYPPYTMLQTILIFLVLAAAQLLVAVLPAKAENTTTIQIIHNSPDTSLTAIDLYLNDELIRSGFSFRDATPFFSIASDTQHKFQIARSPSVSSNESLRTFFFIAEKDNNAAILLQGVIDTLRYAPNPDGKSIALTLLTLDNISLQNNSNSEIPVRIASGCTDLEEVNLVAKDIAPLLQGMTFGSATPTDITFPTVSYNFLLLNPKNQDSILEFPVNLTGMNGQSMILFFSGFNAPEKNCNGKRLGVFGVKKDGTVVNFQEITSVIETKSLHSKFSFRLLGATLEIESSFPPNDETITIYDCLGRDIYSSKLWEQRTSVSLMNFAAGMYFVVIKGRAAEVGFFRCIIE